MKSTKQAYLITSLAFFSLTGFIFSNPEAEVAQFIKQTQDTLKKNHKPNLPPLPVLDEKPVFQYGAGQADPFKLQSFVTDTAEVPVASQNCDTADCGDPPPVPHAPYFLEGYELTKLRMVGTVKSPKLGLSALIQTPDSGVQETRVGQYIGRNNGLILSISPDHIVVQEKYKVPRGWQNRLATLELFN